MNDMNKTVRALISVLAIVIVVAFAAGIILMIAGQFGLGANIWGISIIAGALFLFIKYKREKAAKDLAQQEKEEEEYQKTHTGEKN